MYKKFKNTIYRIFLLASLLIPLLSSCSKEIDFTGEITEPKIVVNGFAIADTTIMINVSKSRFFLDSKMYFDTIKNATVSLFVNGAAVEELTFGTDTSKISYEFGDTIINYITGIKAGYKSVYKPKSGDAIRLVVKVPGFEDVIAETKVQPSVTITNSDYLEKIDTLQNRQDYYLSGMNGQTDTIWTGQYYQEIKYSFKIEFDDPANEANYYRIIAFDSNQYSNYINSDDPVFGNTSEQGLFDMVNQNYKSTFTDELFNGQKKALRFYIITNRYYSSEPNPDKSVIKRDLSFTVDLQQISKETGLYIASRQILTNNTGNPFSEPTQLYTNIQNGLGIFGSITPMKNKIILNLQ